MKTITKERILKALEASSRYLDSKPEIHVVHTLASVGLRASIGKAFGDNSNPITEKDRLELAYQGFTDPEKILSRLSHWSASRSINSAEAIKEAWLSSWKRTLQKKWNRDEKILNIQRRHGISGLNECEIDYGFTTVKYHEPSWELELLQSDYEVMKSERIMLAEAFISALQYHEMKLYRRLDSENLEDDDWVETTSNHVLALANIYQWAKVWESKSYINYRELETKGYTSPLTEAATPDHELEWEFHLVVGNGEPEASKDSVWFCARIGKGSPSL
jgi:hypothetical protein